MSKTEEKEAVETKPEVAPVEMVSVKVIHKYKKALLVEWLEGNTYRRGNIPRQEIVAGQVSSAALDAALPYGVDWSHFDLELDLEEFINELRRQGGYTLDELTNLPPQAFLLAINHASGGIRAKVLEYAAQLHKQEG